MVVKSSGPARFGSDRSWLRIRFPSRAKNAHVVAVLVERMLPASLADDPQQNLLAGMHVRIAVVGLVRILDGVVRIHVIGHRASVDHEVRRMVGLGRNASLQVTVRWQRKLRLHLRFAWVWMFGSISEN